MTDLVQSIKGSTVRDIVSSIEQAVAAGEFVAGDKLPAVRRLADSLDVSPATVAAALAELRRRGVVVSRPRSGTRIAERSAVTPRPEIEVPPGAVDLATGNPDPALLPPFEPHLARLELSPSRYGDPAVLPAFREAMAGQLAADGIPAEHLAVTSGALDGVERVLTSRLRHGDRVAVEDPAYTGILDLVRANSLDAVGVPIDQQGMTPAGLRAALDLDVAAVLITSRGQNPTGAALTVERAAELTEVLEGFPDVLVIEDDHMAQVESTPLVSLGTSRRRWALVRSLNKAFGPDLRLAALTGDAETVALMRGRQRIGPGWVSRMVQALAASMLTDPAVAALLDDAAATYTRRREALIAELASHGITAVGRSGLNVWVPVREEGAVVRALADRGWAVRAGEAYRLATPPGIRVTTASLDPADAARFAADLAAVLRPSTTATNVA